MPVVEESVFVAQPPEMVFDYLTKAENLPVWDASIVEAEQIGSEPVGVGTRSRGISKILGRRFEWTTEETEFESPRRTSVRSVEGKLTFVVTNVLEPVNGGTQYTYRVDAESGLGGIFAGATVRVIAAELGRSRPRSVVSCAATPTRRSLPTLGRAPVRRSAAHPPACTPGRPRRGPPCPGAATAGAAVESGADQPCAVARVRR